MKKPYIKVSAAYSIGMLLYYYLHVFIYKRSDPIWLQEAYMILYALPGIVALKWLPLSLRENTFRHFLRTSFYIFLAFDFLCMIMDGNCKAACRIISLILMHLPIICFVALFLKFNINKIKDL